MNLFVATAHKNALLANFNHRNVAEFSQCFHIVLRIRATSESRRLEFVGKHDVRFLQQFLKELAVLLDNVEAGQVDGDLQAALLGRTGGLGIRSWFCTR